MKNKLWLVGTGAMGVEYAKVLKALNKRFIAIGRSETSCQEFKEKIGYDVFIGGIDNFLETNPEIPEFAIISVGIESLKNTCIKLINYGVKYILLEKPGVGYSHEIIELCNCAKKMNAKVLLAYNRRFYSSVLKAKDIIHEDGGVKSFIFEFTEWSHLISGLKKDISEHNNWFLGNSTHVIDTAFFLAGIPTKLFALNKGSLSWHPTSSIFSGAGITKSGALFSYHANWEGPGRWLLEIITLKHRLIFKPFEVLKIQKIGSVSEDLVEIDNKLDLEFKPGLYRQTEAFLNLEFNLFCNIYQQKIMIDKYYNKMSGY
jgi:predicted dehydrogenase